MVKRTEPKKSTTFGKKKTIKGTGSKRARSQSVGEGQVPKHA